MAKKKYRAKQKSGLKKAMKQMASIGADVLIASPILMPAVSGATKLLHGEDPKHAMGTFGVEAVGYDLSDNTFHPDMLPGIITRDAIMVGGGLLIRKYIVRRM